MIMLIYHLIASYMRVFRYEVAIGPVTGRTLYSYRSGSHVLSIFLFALILLVRVRNRVWCSVRLVLGLGTRAAEQGGLGGL